jgi:arylsulfatase A-like enzyme
MKLLIIGLDGATWSVIDPLLEQGRMPNLARLLERGTRCVSTAIEPALSPIIWTSLASGKLPEKHGVTHFFNTAKNVRCRRLWDILEKEGRSIGLFGWPVTWPPRPIDGFMIPSLFARDNSTFPDELHFVKDLESGLQKGWRERIELIAKAMRHGLRAATVAQIARYALARRRTASRAQPALAQTDLDQFAEQRFLKLEMQLDIFEYLTRAYKPDMASFYMNQIDAFSHRFWRYYEPQLFDDVSEKDVERYGGLVPQVYEAADRAVGRLMQLAEKDTVLAVISDHGFEATDTGAQGRKFCGRVHGSKLLHALGLGDQQATYVNHRAWVMVKLGAEANAQRDELLHRLSTFQVPEFNSDPTRVRPLLKATEDPTGEIAILIHADTEELLDNADLRALHVEYASAQPRTTGDSARQGGNGSARSSALERVRVPLLDLIQPEYDTRMSGVHHPDGITVLTGPGVRVGARIDPTSVLDVTPTLLALSGMPVGRDMDGRALTEAMLPEFLVQTPIHYIESHDAGLEYSEDQDQDAVPEELMSRLRALGYVD